VLPDVGRDPDLARSAYSARVNAARAAAMELGAYIAVPGLSTSPVYVTGTMDDKFNLGELGDEARTRLDAKNDEPFTAWRDGDNVMHTMTPTQFQVMRAKARAHASLIWHASWALKAPGAMVPDPEAPSHWPDPGTRASPAR
jgi:hypothetical protein